MKVKFEEPKKAKSVDQFENTAPSPVRSNSQTSIPSTSQNGSSRGTTAVSHSSSPSPQITNDVPGTEMVHGQHIVHHHPGMPTGPAIYANYGPPLFDASAITDLYKKQMDLLNEKHYLEKTKMDLHIENEKMKQLYQEMRTQMDSYRQELDKCKQENWEMKQEVSKLSNGTVVN